MVESIADISYPLALIGKPQAYAWGKVGRASRIASMLSGVDLNQPLAEFWLGAHPKAPADVVLADGATVPVASLCTGDAAIPFMLKVLSINHNFGLSIQSHPDPSWAKILHARDPINYPDDSHKPEIGVALSPVTLLYGFRHLTSIARNLELYPSLRRVWDERCVARLLTVSAGESDSALVREMFSGLMRCEPALTARIIGEIRASSADRGVNSSELTIMNRLAACHGDGDAGLLAIFVMNIVNVPPGSGVYIGPNIPHAYLDGDLVECMACSDNVIRAGLTSKFTDTEALLSTLSFESGGPEMLRPQIAGEGFAPFDVPTSAFALEMAELGNADIAFRAKDRPSIILGLGESFSIHHAASGVSLSFGDGGSALIPPNSGEYTISRVSAALFWAS